MAEQDKLTLDALWGKLADTADVLALATLVGNEMVAPPTSDIVDKLRALAEQLGTVAIHDDLAPALTVLSGAELDTLRRVSALLAQAVEGEVLRRATALLAVLETGSSQDRLGSIESLFTTPSCCMVLL